MNFSQPDTGRETEFIAALTLRNIKGLGASSAKRLADFFGSPAKALEAAEQWSLCLKNIPPTAIRQTDLAAGREQAGKYLNRLRHCRAQLLLYTDSVYPYLLREISDAPLFFFYIGDAGLLNNVSVAVVGARACTQEGISVAAHIARGLSRAGVTVVSGLALGIDRVAHLAGLEGPGSSIAVLGSGIDVPYPGANLDLYDLMAEKGLLLSEFMPGSPPEARHFPIRNRIISGLSRGILVVEAAMRSGTLITARHAVEQNREVFVVPGSTVSENSAGCRELIRRGAKAVFSAEDILADLAPMLRNREISVPGGPQPDIKKELSAPAVLPWQTGMHRHPPSAGAAPGKISFLPVLAKKQAGFRFPDDLDPMENMVLELLQQDGDCHIDNLSSKLAMEVATLSSLLTILELRGLVRCTPGMFYGIAVNEA